jgi:hypothetical protein
MPQDVGRHHCRPFAWKGTAHGKHRTQAHRYRSVVSHLWRTDFSRPHARLDAQVTDAGDIVDVYYRGGTVEFISEIPADLDPYGARLTLVPPTREMDATLLSEGPT